MLTRPGKEKRGLAFAGFCCAEQRFRLSPIPVVENSKKPLGCQKQSQHALYPVELKSNVQFKVDCNPNSKDLFYLSLPNPGTEVVQTINA